MLPQFAFRVEHLKPLPEFESLTNDPVYQPYIRLAYQHEKKAKERERQAKEETQREQARLRAKLIESGVDPD